VPARLAIASFGETYADQNERAFAAWVQMEACRRGRVAFGAKRVARPFNETHLPSAGES
jgi:hypothetical protein